MNPLPELIAEMEAGLEGTTRGEWYIERFYRDGREWGLIMCDGTIVAEIRGALDSCGNGDNAAHIIKCSPDNIAAIITAYREMEAENARLKSDYLRRNNDAADRAILLREALAALEPFANHLDEMKFDTDNKGNLLPDDQTVGWVYVTNGDFRRARALSEKIKKELNDA